MSRHLFIAGTGRAGTSFLVRFLHAVGLETHLTRRQENASWFDEANAGLEDILVEGCPPPPYFVKSPSLHEWVESLLAREDVQIDGVIIPVRNLLDAATSRVEQERKSIRKQASWMAQQPRDWSTWGYTPGGVMLSVDVGDQARTLAVAFHNLVERLVRADVTTYFLSFPRIVEDGGYLVDKLAPVLPNGISRDEALSAHAAIANPSMVRIGRPRTGSS